MSDYIKRCPACGNDNAPDTLRCACGTLLFGVDLTRPAAESAGGANALPASTAGPVPDATTITCPYDDCGQPNPVGETRCLYCNRPLAAGEALQPASPLLALPAALAGRYRIQRTLPATGAEAEILVVEPLAGGTPRIVKLYRQGVLPSPEIAERLARIPVAHRIEVHESGVSDGHAYELMEYCAAGSLRERMGRAWPVHAFPGIVAELVDALEAVHGANLVHRDLKPDNVLVRNRDPLDLVLADFGIASVLDATQRFTGAARTLPYAAPESISGVIDAAADYWSLGMMLLEAALGRHPFAGLSDAVILHQLTTRSIDLAKIDDANLRKLLRGLLLRDPAVRWRAAEVRRWLAADPMLTEPADQGGPAGFSEPYHLGDERCQNSEQLAVALARHWRAGVADLDNGQLLRWFRDVQKDHNVVRLLLDMQYDRQLPLDTQLLKLILHLAPAVPPVWRGESIELPAVLSRASLALKGDAEAARWLDALHRDRVLETYAEAGNPQAEELRARWTAAADDFLEAWQSQLKHLQAHTPRRDEKDVVLYDDVVYGRHEKSPPPFLALHPRLLAMAYDTSWCERLREHLVSELATLAIDCPWLLELGELRSMAPPALLAFEALLPEARKSAQRHRDREAGLHAARAAHLDRLRQESVAALQALRNWVPGHYLSGTDCLELQSLLNRFFDAVVEVRQLAASDEPAIQLRKELLRAEPVAGRMQELLDALIERRTQNRGWFSPQMLVAQVLAVLLIPAFLSEGAAIPLLLVAAGVAAWRIAPLFRIPRQIRNLAAGLG